jgi:hypothetical protein
MIKGRVLSKITSSQLNMVKGHPNWNEYKEFVSCAVLYRATRFEIRPIGIKIRASPISKNPVYLNAVERAAFVSRGRRYLSDYKILQITKFVGLRALRSYHIV